MTNATKCRLTLAVTTQTRGIDWSDPAAVEEARTRHVARECARREAPAHVAAQAFFDGLERVQKVQLAGGTLRRDLLEPLDRDTRDALAEIAQAWARARRR